MCEMYVPSMAVLADHRRYTYRDAKHDYLLRGLLRCGLCGAPYTTSWSRRNYGARELWRYYACSTRHYRQQYYRRPGNSSRDYPRDCVAASVDAASIEAQIWADVESFIRDPGDVLLRLAAQADEEAGSAEARRAELAEVQRELGGQQAERDAVLALYRKGRITERDLDRQLDAIAAQETSVTARREDLLAALDLAGAQQDRMERARELLQQLHARLDAETLTPAVKRQVVEALVQDVRVDTVEVGLSTRGRIKREASILVTYRFQRPSADAGASQALGDPAQSCIQNDSA
jgi:site-specific DNA recombinase